MKSMTTTTIPEMTAAKTTTLRKNKRSDSATSPHRDLNYYQTLDYPIELIRDEETYVASHPDLPGCVSMGPTPNEAVENLREVKLLWIEGKLANGDSIPEPSRVERYSGKFVLRIPKLLHRMADYRARHEGVSLNSYIVSVLAGALGYPSLCPEPLAPSGKIDWPERYLHGLWRGVYDDWNIAMPSASNRVYRQDLGPSLFRFIGTLAEQIGSNKISTFKPSELEDYHRAEEEAQSVSK
jgi:antitoxin HicB